MTLDEYTSIRNFLEQKSESLQNHECKSIAVTGLPPKNIIFYQIGSRKFYSYGTDIFNLILESVLIQAMAAFPLNFGNNNAISVINAINKVKVISTRLKEAIKILKRENFCYIVELENGLINDKVLRIDLFRELKLIKNEREKHEFIGGIFHAFKHFSLNRKPLSTGNEKYDLEHPRQLINYMIKAFFIEADSSKKEDVYVSYLDISEKRRLKFIFYFEKKTKIYFLKTIHPISIQPTTAHS